MTGESVFALFGVKESASAAAGWTLLSIVNHALCVERAPMTRTTSVARQKKSFAVCASADKNTGADANDDWMVAVVVRLSPPGSPSAASDYGPLNPVISGA